MIDNTLIENALALTGKKLYEMNRWYSWEYEVEYKFCIAEFCYYLLSPEFIEKYRDVIADFYDFDKTHLSIELFAKAVWYYQKWNEEPLKELLYKICN